MGSHVSWRTAKINGLDRAGSELGRGQLRSEQEIGRTVGHDATTTTLQLSKNPLPQ